MLRSVGLPAVPGSLWAMFSRLAWADPNIARAHAIPFTAQLNGTTSLAGVPADGVAVAAENQVVAKMYFLVSRIDGYAVYDPTNPLEATLGDYVYVQLVDQERNTQYGRVSFNLSHISGNWVRHPHPLIFDERPLTYLPNANIRVDFTPKAGFPDTVAHAITTLTTREVGLIMHGMLIDETIVDNLLEGNHDVLDKFGLRRLRR